MDQAQSEEIDLFSIFETLWDSKWKIIFFIFISSIASISYLFFTPNSFKVTTKLHESNQDLYYKYKYLNDILENDGNHNTNYLDAINNDRTNNTNQLKIEHPFLNEKFKVDNLLIFETFINEFNDYEEMVSVLSENDYVKDEIKNLI